MPEPGQLCVCGHEFKAHAQERMGFNPCQAAGCNCECFNPDREHPANQERGGGTMAKQADLIEGRGIAEIDKAAESVRELTDDRMSVHKREMSARETLLTLMRKQSDALSPPWPDLVIAASRRSVPIARWIRKQSGDRTRLVHLFHTMAPFR